jgi:LDH2 family malate/lactate/ureidoglycolate dehydrogenase
VDILTGALAGSFCGKDVPPLEDLTTPYGASFFMLALDPSCFAGVDVFNPDFAVKYSFPLFPCISRELDIALILN